MAAYTTIDDAGSLFNTLLWTGTSASHALTGVGFQPDFTWIKSRDSGYQHELYDSVRGATNFVSSDDNAAQETETEGLKSFDSDGYTLGTRDQVNDDTKTYLGSSWLAGTTTGIDTTGADLTVNGYSFNQAAGFSVIEYEGNNVNGAYFPHGLGAVPQIVIIKSLDTATDWTVYHHLMDVGGNANTRACELNTNAQDASVNFWKDTTPTSVLVRIDNSAQVNPASTMLAYCFTPIQGFSKFGTYEGNGNVDGPFVYTGFRPAFIITKDQEASGNWNMWNNRALGYNEENRLITCNQDAAEIDRNFDILSNGFKPRDSGQSNEAGNAYIYLAYAESPFCNSNGVPTNAR